MMPLTLADPGEEAIIKRVGGSPEMKNHGRGRRHGDEHHRRQSDRENQGIPRGHQQGNGRKNHDIREK